MKRPLDRRLSRVRWSYGLLSVFGLMAVAVSLSDAGAREAGPWRGLWVGLWGAGVPVLLGAFAVAVGLPRLRPGPWPHRAAALLSAWALALTLATALDPAASGAPAVVLFVLLPAVGGWMRLQDAGRG
jgi:hypothetical protein